MASPSDKIGSPPWSTLLDNHLRRAARPLIVLLGPTASGKTALSLDAARHIDQLGKQAEIVNGDSRQLYRHLDIGTAKITREEMGGTPHHLLDVRDPSEEVTIAWYKEQATNVIDDIHARGNIPLLVGGSMLYISAVIDGLEPLPSDPGLRTALEEEYGRDEGRSLHRRLEEIDPDAAAGIPVQNKVYLIRAMEICTVTGSRSSDVKRQSSCPYDLLILGVDRPREELIARINARTKQMFEQGWIDEVRSLLQRGYSIHDPGMKSHGYREIAEMTQKGIEDTAALQETISAKTRQYAKRQLTWWRGDERIRWITCES